MNTSVVIDCDSNPEVPEGLYVRNHKKGGQLEFDGRKVLLHRAPGQNYKTENGVVSEQVTLGPYMYAHIRDRCIKVLNANVLDFLLQNPDLIPEEWKGQKVFFWGTTYGGEDFLIAVRFLWWDKNEGWVDGYAEVMSTSSFFLPDMPAACLK